MDIYSNSIKIQYYVKMILVSLLVAFQLVCSVEAGTINSFDLKLGKMADYGASPWYTEDILIGTSKLKFSPDSGANFTWATSDLCKTNACKDHQKVNTSQCGFVWIDAKPTKRSFGPWGSMMTKTCGIPFNSPKVASVEMDFFAAVEYAGAQFKFLAWDGGIGFPSTTAGVEKGSDFYFGSLYARNIVKKPTFSIVTHPHTKQGTLYLGGEDPNQYIADTAIELQPNTTGAINYIWGTDLYSVSIGKYEIPSLTSARFYLDTGSSLFKGDDFYITPILQQLYATKDADGNLIFEKVYDEKKWVSLVYIGERGPKDYATGTLPDMTLTIGQSCNGKTGASAQITLSPEQYSYKVEEGDRAGRWVPAFAVLNGVGGLLVGSTFMDFLYTTFNYVDEGKRELSQGNMHLYKKSSGEGPKSISCVPTPSPVAGTWFNSYCSQVSLSVSASGQISGVYTSHTGSTGSSNVVGWVGASQSSQGNDAIYGIPVALGIQWRLINQLPSEADGSWNWVSTFSGQYHPDQIVSESGQKDYPIKQTLEVLNGLIATSTVSGFTDTAPKMWPQTLKFSRIPPSYCKPITPPAPIPFSGTAKDKISGSWENPSGDTLDLIADMKTAIVTGKYTTNRKPFTVVGLADAIGPIEDSKLVEQSVALTMRDKEGNVFSMAGGVDLNNINTMNLWVDGLTSTTWTNRFTESTLDKTTWTRVQ